MSEDPLLERLATQRAAILYAETAAWLHDMAKCSQEHIENQARDQSRTSQFARTAIWAYIAFAPPLEFDGETIELPKLFKRDCNDGWLACTLQRCHNAAHVEKAVRDEWAKQLANDTRPATAFGYEGKPIKNLTERLNHVPWQSLDNRTVFERSLRQAFSEALGDTRRPDNEVTLWDWSSVVAALYKAAIAGAVLRHKPDPERLRWRFLSVRVDSLAFMSHVSRIPDLLARQDILRDAFERVRFVLEENYPIGTRVYQDQETALFVLPHLPTEFPPPLRYQNRDGDTLEKVLYNAFAHGTMEENVALAISGEVVPQIEWNKKVWQGQFSDKKTVDIPPIAEILHAAPCTTADAARVKEWWEGETTAVCRVCGIRPQGPPGSKAAERQVCVPCEERRQDRSRAWTKNLATTIWLDEVADENGRLALLAGQFALDPWLDGSMVNTLRVDDPRRHDSLPKIPSFARLRRIWETTQTFWETALSNEPFSEMPPAPRLAIFAREQERLNLGAFHTYEFVLPQGRLSVVWDSDARWFVTCDNLAYLAKPELFGESVIELLERAQKRGQPVTLAEPAGYGTQSVPRGEVVIERIEGLPEAYARAIVLQTDPQAFMVLLPADRALQMARQIKQKYEREMGKVRNRLTLTLGIAYFNRGTPIAAALDTARRFLKNSTAPQPARVAAVANESNETRLTLNIGARELALTVPTVMGDGETFDVWYPYWQLLEGDLTSRVRTFAAAGGRWVHVTELRINDVVEFAPSLFDFEFLDTTARRFEVTYQHAQRRAPFRAMRPYLLEELDTLTWVWEHVGPTRLTATQLQGVNALIESKRREWNFPAGEQALTWERAAFFMQFCRDALANAQWQGAAWKEWDEKSRTILVNAAQRGLLAEVMDLYLTLHSW